VIPQADILGASPSSLGALLVGIGAILLLVDAFAGPGLGGTTWGGTLPTNPSAVVWSRGGGLDLRRRRLSAAPAERQWPWRPA